MEGFQLIGFDWRYLYVNDAVVKQSKYSREELIGFTMQEKYPGIEKTEMFRTLEYCMKERVPAHMDNEFTFPDGSKGCFELRIQPVPKGLFILSVDVSERKRAEEEKKQYVSGLEEMLFMTSHKVRQPITHIMGAYHLLEKSSHSTEEVRQIADYIKASIISLDNFTKELNTFLHDQKIRTAG